MSTENTARPNWSRRYNDKDYGVGGLAAPPIAHMDLVACARAVDWDFTTWCYASGHDAADKDARLMFECLLAYASRPEGRAGLN